MNKNILYAVILIVIVTILVTVMFATVKPYQHEYGLGRFVEIEHNNYVAPNGCHACEYLVYDSRTHIVYIYILSSNSETITPYMMRDSYGMLTVGIYDLDACVIKPAEPDYSDEVELVVLG